MIIGLIIIPLAAFVHFNWSIYKKNIRLNVMLNNSQHLLFLHNSNALKKSTNVQKLKSEADRSPIFWPNAQQAPINLQLIIIHDRVLFHLHIH